MPYCPKCREEFQNWVMKCLDCGVPLVDILPDLPVPEPEPPPKPKEEPIKESLVHIATAPSEPLAMMWTGILEDEGIYALVKTGDLSAAYYMPSLLSSCEIHVVASQADEAKKILDPLIRDSESTP
jgi:hypothetical protein